MRIKILTILLLAGFVGFASVPKEEATQKLQFGISEFNKALSYNAENASLPFANETFKKHFAHLAKKQAKYKSQSQFVEYTFYYLHKKLLKKYKQYASINQTMETGVYDCVTATAVYSLFLTELEIPYSVVETNYHIYVLVFPGTENEVLLETTDPIAGFISNSTEIVKRKLLYVKSNSEVKKNQVDLAWNVETSLNGTELMGVLLYNQSIKQYNVGNKSEAISLAIDALTYYSSARIKTYLSFIKGDQFASN